MRTIQEPKKVALWNKWHFEEKKWRVSVQFKKFSMYICWKQYIKWGVWRVAVCLSYIQDTQFLKVNGPNTLRQTCNLFFGWRGNVNYSPITHILNHPLYRDLTMNNLHKNTLNFVNVCVGGGYLTNIAPSSTSTFQANVRPDDVHTWMNVLNSCMGEKHCYVKGNWFITNIQHTSELYASSFGSNQHSVYYVS
jgi:hypothetical protein